MYEAFFSLRELPFALTPDPRFLWMSETHQEGLAMLYYGISRRKGFILLTGEVGAGKTTLLRTTLHHLEQDVNVALLMNTSDLDPVDLLKLIVAEFGLRGRFETKADYIIALNQFLLERLEHGLNTLLIIDEAQNLDGNMLEQVRLLSNLETNTQKLIQIVLTGQPELLALLSTPEMSPLRQRIALEHHVRPLREEEVGPYLVTVVLWAWGEPLLHPQLPEAVRIATRHGVPVLVSTNGQNLGDQKVLEGLIRHPPTYLIVAIDGLVRE